MDIPPPSPLYAATLTAMDTLEPSTAEPLVDPLDELLQPSRVLEPLMSKGDKSDPTNPYEGRWRWWYSAIADYMIRNPSGSIAACAREIGRGPNTVSMIINTDLFRDYLQQRKSEWAREHDFALRARLTDTALKALDLTFEVLQKKGDQVPLQRLVAIAESSLDRLGYAPTSTTVIVDQSKVDNRQQTINVSGQTLLQARDAMRAVESLKAGISLPAANDPTASVPEATEAGPQTVSGTDLLGELEK